MAKDTISEKKGLLTSKGENRIGTFDEGYGGGTPIDAGKKLQMMNGKGLIELNNLETLKESSRTIQQTQKS